MCKYKCKEVLTENWEAYLSLHQLEKEETDFSPRSVVFKNSGNWQQERFASPAAMWAVSPRNRCCTLSVMEGSTRVAWHTGPVLPTCSEIMVMSQGHCFMTPQSMAK